MNPPHEIEPPNVIEYENAIRFLYDRINYEKIGSTTTPYPFRLRRMTELASRMGLNDFLYAKTSRPRVPLIHVAGTKGKGSTASMVATILTSAGYRTGLYTSPHLHQLEERFQIDGAPCSAAQLTDLVTRARQAVSGLEISLAQSNPATTHGEATFFELTTAMAMLHFHMSQCDAIVLEVGLGGRLDSTNVFASTVTAITSIGLDHQHVLGNTIEEIASEKAGIIKANVPIVSGVLRPNAANAISEHAKQKDAPIFQIGADFSVTSEPDLEWGQRINYIESVVERSLYLSLEGEHQARNAAVALRIVSLLEDQGMTIQPDEIGKAFGAICCSARTERIQLEQNLSLLVDAAHNEDSIVALVEVVNQRFKNNDSERTKIVVVFGTSSDKPADKMLERLSMIAETMILTQYHSNPRYFPAAQLRPMIEANQILSIRTIEDSNDAFQAAWDDAKSFLDSSLEPNTNAVIVVCGSFFLAADARVWGMKRLESA